MKKLYSFLMTATALLGFSLSANANVTCDLKWEYPGSVKIYVGGNAESYRVDVPADATSYHVDYENSFGTVYVKPVTGYFVNKAVCSDASHAEPVTMDFNSWTGGVSINISDNTNYHEGHEVWIDVSMLAYDKEFSLDMLSSGKVTAKFEETGREVALKYGSQTISYASSHEKTLTFYGTTSVYSDSNPDGYEDGVFYLKHNGIDCNWKLQFGNWKHEEIVLTGNDTFEVKFNSGVPAVGSTFTVTPVYTNELAKTAISMVFNVTQKSTIAYSAPNEAFDVNANDVVRFSFNTKDYVVEVNGNAINSTGDYTSWEIAITEDTTVEISATERTYGKVNVSIAVTDPEGIVVHDGSFDGPIVDISGLTPATDTFLGTTYQLFTISVDGKLGKAFVAPADGWGITESLTGTGGNDLQDTYAASTTSGTLHVKVHKINRESKLVVNVALGQDGSVSNVRLRNSQREIYTLAAGYNVIDFDPEWDSPFEISPVDVIMESDPDLGKIKENFSVFLNYSAVKYNSDNVAYSGIIPTDNSVLYIFVKQPNPALRYVTFNIAEGLDAPEVTYDVVKTIVPSADNNYQVRVFSGTEISVKLAQGTTVEGYEKDIVNGILTVCPTSALDLKVIEQNLPDADFSPADAITNYADYMEPVAVFFSDEVMAEIADVQKIKVSFNDEVLAADDFTASCEGKYFKLQVSNAKYFYLDGVLTLDLAAGALQVDGILYPAISHSWVVVKDMTTALDITSNDADQKANVFAIDGRVLLLNATPAQINALPAGIYIINSKRLLKK